MPKETRREVGIQLNKDEIRERGELLAKLEKEEIEVTLEFAKVKADYKKQFKAIDERREILVNEITTGFHRETVICRIEIDRDKMMRYYVDLSTGQTVDQEPATNSDMQLDIEEQGT